MGDVGFGVILRRLLANPLWVETLAAMRAQAAIERAFHQWEDAEARTGVVSALVLADDDWAVLKRAAEQPRTVMGDSVSIGLGFHPQLASQLVPFLAAIVDAPPL